MKLILFGGKGGVGKTTCASSAGLHFSGKNEKTLVICTDPAHSLSDSLGQEIGNEVKKIEGVNNLSALEVNSEKVLSLFKKEHEEEIKQIMDTSTHLDKEDIDSIFKLPIPGMDELMGFKTIVDLVEEGNFDKYIVDTAPTGHALRLLSSPHLIDDWIKVMAKMRWKYRYIVKSFTGKYTSDKGDDFLMSLKKTVKKIEKLLSDSKQSEFIVVTVPEKMVIFETERLVEKLEDFGIKVNRIVVNDVLESDGCHFCRERKKEQQKNIDIIKNKFKKFDITLIPLQEKAVSGIEVLDNIKRFLFS